MRIAKFETGAGTGLGAVQDGDRRLARLPWASFEELFAEPDPLAAVAAIEVSGLAIVEASRLLPPVVAKAQFIGTGGNYADHATEARQSIQVSEPVFLPFLWGAVIGPDDDIVVPTADTQTDYEVELSVIIGREARRLTPANAMDYVFGYTIANDVSARDVTAREKMQIMLSKSVDTFLPIGPYVVTRDDIPDVQNLEIGSYLNGEPRQKSNTRHMTSGIPVLLAALTRAITLHPGDLVTTGTPAGVGYFRTPPEYMKPGDTITVEIEHIGRMANRLTQGW
jgi:2,4-didehydro-3-deoxy-L-rhamnonate hydrolase